MNNWKKEKRNLIHMEAMRKENLTKFKLVRGMNSLQSNHGKVR